VAPSIGSPLRCGERLCKSRARRLPGRSRTREVVQMTRGIVAAAIVALVVGILGGFLFWGLRARSLQAELRQAQERPAALEREVDEARVQVARLEAELQSFRARLKELEEDLAREREQRSRLEDLISRGKK
jgi:septal ring factor EnvC (AmiA/AmiB activator)